MVNPRKAYRRNCDSVVGSHDSCMENEIVYIPESIYETKHITQISFQFFLYRDYIKNVQ